VIVRCEPIDGIGHRMQLEAPLAVNRLLLGFLRS
jgi:pimeloyl-ACP methyl ester carboxylesterase